MTTNSFGARSDLTVGGASYEIHRLDAVGDEAAGLPYSMKVLLENLLRQEDGETVTAEDIEALARWDGGASDREISFMPARILMQDFTGVPAVVDLAAMRDAVEQLGGRAGAINPLIPTDLVIDHSVSVDTFARPDAFARNVEIEFERNGERYQFLKWGQQAFDGFRVVPPGTGICHQVNLEHLARVVFVDEATGRAYPDTLVGTDSHTPMVNGLGVLGWGVGGIEAEAAMLGQPISMLLPRVVGVRLEGELPEGATATDLVLTVTELLREHGVVGKFVEFYGPGVGNVPVENRATIGNMSPEYGSTVTIFPIDEETLRYLRFTGRPDSLVELVERYAKEQGLWFDPQAVPRFSETIELDLSSVVPSIAGPSRPQDRVALSEAKARFATALLTSLPEQALTGTDEASAESFPASDPPAASEGVTGEGGAEPEAAETRVAGPRSAGAAPERVRKEVPVTLADGTEVTLDHGHVVIAAITSCTNTSNPSVMLAAGLLAKKAVERGLTRQPWVKTSLAPGSKAVMDYYERAGLTPYLEKLGFHLAAFGCTTCIGNSGPLPPEISTAVNDEGLAVVSVLSGNRNFEGRINGDVRMNYLASPPLVVAYALAGTMDRDLVNEPLGTGSDGEPVYLRDIWPTDAEVTETLRDAVRSEMFDRAYADVFAGDERWTSLESSTGERYEWSDESTYVRNPPHFDGLTPDPAPLADITGARALAVLGDSVTTDHISPAGAIRPDSPAGQWLQDHGVAPADFNSYGSRRGNHEVMIRGTFANVRIRNRLAPGTEGGVTLHLPDGEEMTIYDAAMRYQDEGVPLVVLAGKEYGSGSSRDWAAKGTFLLGVSAVLAESYERIHRSNLIGMGVLPLELPAGETVESLGLTGHEQFDIVGLDGQEVPPSEVEVRAGDVTFTAKVRIDTPREADYYRHGGILRYVLRDLARR
ncbi:aconitate hydratase [Actinomarinicola tropica]|uniref:Aconitate hydratase A n=1 Tax=Actinomarinicola tropica TaxID=2789776 RepID=A0A5Q2RM68_9ACTN|nr:aconitate hydratase [Actinomarinicola tropica]QGG94285.1 aconitate hydratase AcnA [Actinomarinicola tropica]